MKKYMDIPQILRDFLTYHENIKGQSPRTISEYYLDLRMFLRFIHCLENSLNVYELDKIELDNFNENSLKDITLSDLYEFMSYVNNEKSSNDNYRARKVASLKSCTLSARTMCDAVCDALGCEPVLCVGNRFVIYKRSDKKEIEHIKLVK